MAGREKSWREMSRRERFAVIRQGLEGRESSPPEAVDRIMGRVERYFLARATTDPTVVMNAMLREAWREEHGDTVEWDRAAAAMRQAQRMPIIPGPQVPPSWEREPTVEGPAGRAWRWVETEDDPTGLAMGRWLLHCPGSHPLWSWYVLIGVALREHPLAQPPHLQYPEAEYELIVLALRPDAEPPVPEGSEPMQYLSPPDQVHQIHDVPQGDTGARRLLDTVAEACVHGILVPDQDHRAAWASALDATLRHLRAGVHPITEDEAA